MTSFKKPHLYLWLMSAFFLLYGVLNREFKTIDLSLFDSYYVISYNWIAMAIAILLLTVGFVSWTAQKISKRK